jgi:hypothetical protein
MQLVKQSLAVSDYVCFRRGIPKGQLSLALNSSSQGCILCSSAHCTHQAHPFTLTHTERQAMMQINMERGRRGETFHQLSLPSSLSNKTQPLPWHVPGAPAGPGSGLLRALQRGQRVSERVTGGASAWPNLRLVLKTTLTSVSGGPKHNAHRLCPVDAESVNMDREETHRLGLGPAGGESGHTRLLRQARGRSCAGWRGGEDHCCVVLLVLCVPKVYYR